MVANRRENRKPQARAFARLARQTCGKPRPDETAGADHRPPIHEDVPAPAAESSGVPARIHCKNKRLSEVPAVPGGLRQVRILFLHQQEGEREERDLGLRSSFSLFTGNRGNRGTGAADHPDPRKKGDVPSVPAGAGRAGTAGTSGHASRTARGLAGHRQARKRPFRGTGGHCRLGKHPGKKAPEFLPRLVPGAGLPHGAGRAALAPTPAARYPSAVSPVQVPS